MQVPTRRPLLALVLLAALVAGCSSPAATAPGPSPEPGTMRVLDHCRFACFEPSLAVAANGSLYATAGSEGVYRGDPAAGGGFRWTNVTPDDPGLEGYNGPADRIVQVGPDGTVAVSELQITRTGPRGVRLMLRPPGAQDWAETAFSNGFISTPSHDRQWVGFGPGGQVAVIYKDQNSALYLHRSSDGGRTFDDGVIVAQQRLASPGPGAPGVGASIVAGPPVVLQDRVLVPLFYDGLLDVAEVRGGSPSVLRPVLVGNLPVEGDYFPILTVAPDGAWWMAARAGGPSVADLALLRSAGDGSWAAVEAPAHEKLTASPWVEVSANGTVHVAWTQGTQLMHAVQNAKGAWDAGPVGSFVPPEGLDRNTDFAHFALRGETAWFAQSPGDGVVVGSV